MHCGVNGCVSLVYFNGSKYNGHAGGGDGGLLQVHTRVLLLNGSATAINWTRTSDLLNTNKLCCFLRSSCQAVEACGKGLLQILEVLS